MIVRPSVRHDIAHRRDRALAGVERVGEREDSTNAAHDDVRNTSENQAASPAVDRIAKGFPESDNFRYPMQRARQPTVFERAMSLAAARRVASA